MMSKIDMIHSDECKGWRDPDHDFNGCDCGTDEIVALRAELAAVKAERDELRRQPCINCHGTGKCACGDCKRETCTLCGGTGRTVTLSRDDVATEMRWLSSQRSAAANRAADWLSRFGEAARERDDALAERDAATRRAEVAEAALARVQKLAQYHLDAPGDLRTFRRIGEELLAAIGGYHA